VLTRSERDFIIHPSLFASENDNSGRSRHPKYTAWNPRFVPEYRRWKIVLGMS